MAHQRRSRSTLENFGRSLLVLVIALAALLAVRAWVANQLGYTPLPIAEPLPYHAATVFTVGLASAAAGLLVHGWRGTALSTLSAFAVYLGWAVVQQNLIVNPDLWKLWERHWLTVALACGLAGLVLSLALQVIARASRQRAAHMRAGQ